MSAAAESGEATALEGAVPAQAAATALAESVLTGK